ncbi:hypothetical protein GQX74_004058 [Glossina fuscipes]|nr:hypothetical protein GQX74_004058 [Glossina fuscipes]
MYDEKVLNLNAYQAWSCQFFAMARAGDGVRSFRVLSITFRPNGEAALVGIRGSINGCGYLRIGEQGFILSSSTFKLDGVLGLSAFIPYGGAALIGTCGSINVAVYLRRGVGDCCSLAITISEHSCFDCVRGFNGIVDCILT